jgi:hypothetical protein
VLHLQNTYTHTVNQRETMQSTRFNKIAYAVLITLMLGVTTGWLGGL